MDNLIISDDDQKEELHFVEGGAPIQTGIVDTQLTGAPALTPDRPTDAKEQNQKTKSKTVESGANGVDGAIDGVLDGLTKGRDIELAIGEARERAAGDAEIAEILKELQYIDDEVEIASRKKRLQELEVHQQAAETKSKPKKRKLDSFMDGLRDSMAGDIRIFTKKLPAAIKGSWLQGRMDKNIMKVQKEINDFRRSKGLEDIPVGVMRKKAGRKQNISVRESDSEFQNRFIQQVRQAQGLGMGTPKGMDAALQAADRLEKHKVKNIGNEI